eukprot:GHVN01091080.1.p2 GENE.GHVN01091080.1~~GHVN01091080.1.p2  ORF type:complete len:115 (+),score=16.09 GHVN01091080.1:163-507(+)
MGLHLTPKVSGVALVRLLSLSSTFTQFTATHMKHSTPSSHHLTSPHSTSDPYSVMATQTDTADLTIHKDGSLSGTVFMIRRDLEEMVIFEGEAPVVVTPLPRPVNRFRSSHHGY